MPRRRWTTPHELKMFTAQERRIDVVVSFPSGKGKETELRRTETELRRRETADGGVCVCVDKVYCLDIL